LKIDKIVLGLNKNDLHWAKICIASIRYWNTTIPVELLVDQLNGPVNTSEIEAHFNATLYQAPIQKLGWGINTLLPITNKTGKRTLFIDADIVWLGDLVAFLEKHDENVLVSIDHPENLKELMELAYFSENSILKLDSEFKLPTFLFNCGHLVFNEGFISKEYFDPLIDWNTTPPILLHKDIFVCADQSILNYLITKLLHQNKITVKPLDFALWGYSDELKSVSLEDIVQRQDHPQLIHWSGKKSHRLSKIPRADIITFYETAYYNQVPWGELKKQITHLNLYIRSIRLQFKKLIVKLKRELLVQLNLGKQKEISS
jgi:hypothetical protein